MTSSPRETSVLKHRPANEYKWSNVTASVPMAKGEMRKFIGTLKVQSTSRRMSSLSRTRIRCNTVMWPMRTSEYICCILKLGFTKLLKKCKIWYLQNRANKIHFIIKIMNFVSTYTIDSKSKYMCCILKLGFTKLLKKCKIWYFQNRANKIHFIIKIMNFVSTYMIVSKSKYICCILKLGFTKLLKKCKIWYLQNRANKIHFIIKIMNFMSTYTIDRKSKYICCIFKLGFTKLFKKCKIWYLQNRAKKIHFSIKIMNFVSICTIDSKSAYGIQSWYTWNLEQCWIALELIVAEYDKTRIRLVSDIPSTWELKSETTLMRTVGKLYGI